MLARLWAAVCRLWSWAFGGGRRGATSAGGQLLAEPAAEGGKDTADAGQPAGAAASGPPAQSDPERRGAERTPRRRLGSTIYYFQLRSGEPIPPLASLTVGQAARRMAEERRGWVDVHASRQNAP